MIYHPDYDSWQGDPADETPEPSGLRLALQEYGGCFSVTDLDNYAGPGDLIGSGKSAADAFGDWAEQHGEAMYVRALTEAYDETNALGGSDRARLHGKTQHWDAGYNRAIDDVLKLLVQRGALTVAERKRRNSR
jgi:hypothetical protein